METSDRHNGRHRKLRVHIFTSEWTARGTKLLISKSSQNWCTSSSKAVSLKSCQMVPFTEDYSSPWTYGGYLSFISPQLLSRTWWWALLDEHTTTLSCRTWESYAGTHLEDSFLPVSFHSAGQCYTYHKRRKAIISLTTCVLCELW